jgi:hypothetical protein
LWVWVRIKENPCQVSRKRTLNHKYQRLRTHKKAQREHCAVEAEALSFNFLTLLKIFVFPISMIIGVSQPRAVTSLVVTGRHNKTKHKLRILLA